MAEELDPARLDPGQLDPEPEEFADRMRRLRRLRRLVDGSGLSVATVADRTGYSETAWESYLDGRSEIPDGALHALADVTDTRTLCPRDKGEGRRRGHGGRNAAIFATGLAGALLVLAAAVLLTDVGGVSGHSEAVARPAPASAPPAVSRPPSLSPSPLASPSTSTDPLLPTVAKCAGATCAGGDPQAMGCAEGAAETVSSAAVGTARVELRYSRTCGAVWARVSLAVPGDSVRLAPRTGPELSSAVDAGGEAYTPMAVAQDPAGARACARLATGEDGCTAAPARPGVPGRIA
ncbi:DUF2690 domain-containing protein [Streptomyces sp. 150FB]|uniref:DUF2690 domain-containing protein n=1 Tax=Streptomyces sp. 150FB TaxID=1576605 RepID=UPI000696AF7F|nr:DUF2690 domain-containing protein [Streptomyces sp. 150FB]